MNREDVKAIVTAIVKSPAVWVAGIIFVEALQRWLAPGVPADVVQSGKILIAAIVGVFGITVSVYLAGKTVQARQMAVAKQSEEMAKQPVQARVSPPPPPPVVPSARQL